MQKRDLLQRLSEGPVICAEGYLFELERRGYLQAGTFVPEVALEHPEVLEMVHREFVHAGSDIVQAFTYNGHREKLRHIGKEHLLEPLNRSALRTAKKVADEAHPESALVAGNISNTNIFDPHDDSSKRTVRQMFEEMVVWAKEEQADFIIGETFYYHQEAEIALEVIKKHSMPAVITLGQMSEPVLSDHFTVAESCRRLKDMGADVVGMNCFRGPAMMTEPLLSVRQAVEGPVAALPVPYRTTVQYPTFFNLPDMHSHSVIPTETTFPLALEPFSCNRFEIADWARSMYYEHGVNYLGLCCGATPVTIRAVAEAVGKKPPATRYSPDMSKHFIFGDKPQFESKDKATGTSNKQT